jgi:putative ABC transport system permease protein
VGFLQDLRYAIRTFRKDAVFTLIAVLSLALGTGANSAMFSFVNGLLLRPLPVSNSSGVLTVAPTESEKIVNFGGISYPDYLDYRDRTKTMTDLVAFDLWRFGFSLSPDVVPQAKYGLLVSGNLFQAMGVKPIIGRAFRPDEDKVSGRDAVVVLGHDFWRDQFGSDPNVAGRTIRLNGLEFTIIGVAPESFTGMDEFFKAAMFVPAMMASRFSADPDNNILTRRDWRYFGIKGRLKAGVDTAQAESEFKSIAHGLEEEHPDTNAGRSIRVRTEVQTHFLHLPLESGLMVMAMIMGCLVLLISCFNVANLLLSRTRTREVAVRQAIGAGRGRLVRQLLTESLLLGTLGTIAGLSFAWIGARLLSRIRIPSDLPFMMDFQTNQRVLLFTLTAGFLSVLLFGLAPALHGSKIDLVSSLKATDEAIGSGKRRSWGRNVLVIAQISISAVILLVTTMLYNAFATQLIGNAGLPNGHLLMMSFDPRLVRYDLHQNNEFYRRLVDQARLVPGVKSVALAATIPFALNQRGTIIDVTREGDQTGSNQEKDHVYFDLVDENFFQTMNVHVIRGRGLLSSDKADSPRVTIVNEALAQKYWPNEDPIGKRLMVDLGDQGVQSVQVVGVAQTLKYTWLTEPPTRYLYLPMAQAERFQGTVLFESYGDSASIANPIRDLVHRLDANMPIFEVHTIEEFYQGFVVASADDTLFVIGSMAVTGLVLAMIGLYGLVSYSVARRTREFGIRMAIGASKSSVLVMVLRQGALLCLAGIAGGIAVSVPASWFMKSIVFGANSDVYPYIVVPIVLMVVTLIAVFAPAHHASTIDAMKALRDE